MVLGHIARIKLIPPKGKQSYTTSLDSNIRGRRCYTHLSPPVTLPCLPASMR